MKLTHHGHSCIELDAGGVRVLFDPGTFSSFDDVKGVDAIVVTHQHADHLDPGAIDSLRAENPDAVWFAEPQTAQLLADKGVEATATGAILAEADQCLPDAVAGLICRYLGLPADTGTTGVDGAGTTGRS